MLVLPGLLRIPSTLLWLSKYVILVSKYVYQPQELKQKLQEAGVDFSGCAEKSEFVELAVKHLN